jgi:hypothetical protein
VIRVMILRLQVAKVKIRLCLGRAAVPDDVRATVVHARSEGVHPGRLQVSAPSATAVKRDILTTRRWKTLRAEAR